MGRFCTPRCANEALNGAGQTAGAMASDGKGSRHQACHGCVGIVRVTSQHATRPVPANLGRRSFKFDVVIPVCSHPLSHHCGICHPNCSPGYVLHWHMIVSNGTRLSCGNVTPSSHASRDDGWQVRYSGVCVCEVRLHAPSPTRAVAADWTARY